jgi:hypothetical protein
MKRNKYLLIALVGIVLLTFGLIYRNRNMKVSKITQTANKISNVIRGNDGFAFDESTPGYETYLSLTQGCSTKDCIPSIDDPEFEPADDADQWLDSADTVFILDYEGEVVSFPQRILNRHEIVNVDVAGDPLVITFCPLCGSALAFERTLDGRLFTFGVSGKLHNNDLVMYDRETESLWQQITGEAIVGELFGKKLKQISFGAMTWEEAKKRFPKLMSLKRPGPVTTYEIYPYGNYESDPNPLFPMDVDSSIHPKTVVFGVEVEGKFKAYSEEELKKLENEELRDPSASSGQAPKLKDSVGKVSVEISYNSGDVEVRRLDSGEEVVATRLFWFAWAAFHPETELY